MPKAWKGFNAHGENIEKSPLGIPTADAVLDDVVYAVTSKSPTLFGESAWD